MNPESDHRHIIAYQGTHITLHHIALSSYFPTNILPPVGLCNIVSSGVRLGRNRSVVGNHHFPVVPLYTDDKDDHNPKEKTRSYSSTIEEYNSSQSQSQPSQSQASQPSQSSQPSLPQSQSQSSQSRPQSPLPTKSLIQRSTLPFVKTVVVTDTDTPSLSSSQGKGARTKPVWSTIAYYEVTIVHPHPAYTQPGVLL